MQGHESASKKMLGCTDFGAKKMENIFKFGIDFTWEFVYNNNNGHKTMFCGKNCRLQVKRTGRRL